MDFLQDFFREHPRAALAFSGGVDSAWLLYAGLKSGADIRPYFVRTPFQPQFELDDAQRLAGELGVSLSVVDVDVLSLPQVAANGEDRCYHCKRAIFQALLAQAAEDGFSLLLDGTNASDAWEDRPGMRALVELGVRSPLRERGLSKEAIRCLSRQAGLFTWDKPAYACLATRIPWGTPLTEEQLRRVEQAEAALRSLGYSDLRVRLFQEAARVQLPQDQLVRAAVEAENIRETLAPWFDAVLLDLKGR